MENKINFSAKEAREQTNKNQISLELILAGIEQSSEHGRNQHPIPFLNNDTMYKLVNLGYTISKTQDNIGLDMFIISW